MVAFNAGMHMEFEDCSGVLSRICEEATKFACFCHYEDGAQRKHVHFYVEYSGKESRSKTWKNWIEEIRPMGRNDWWFPTTQKKNGNKPVDESVIVYMTKGKYKSVMTKGFTEQQIQDFSSKWVNPVKEKVVVGETSDLLTEFIKKKTKTQWELQEEMIEILHDQFDEDGDAFVDVIPKISPAEIYKVVRTVLHKNLRKMSDRSALDYIQSIQSFGPFQEERVIKMLSRW